MTTTAMGRDSTRTLWIGNEPNPDDRLQIDVSPEDYAKIPPRGRERVGVKVTVTDLRTERRLTIVGAECGCASPCALELVKWLDNDTEPPRRAGAGESPIPLPLYARVNVAEKTYDIFNAKKLLVAAFASKDEAEYLIRAANNYQKLVDALKMLVAMDNCNYDLETMRRSGLFEQVKEALEGVESD